MSAGRFFMDYLVGRMSYIFFCVTNFKFNEEVLYMKKVYQGIRMWSRIVKMSPVIFDSITNYIRKQLVKE